MQTLSPGKRCLIIPFIEGDPLRESVKRLIENGIMAQMPGSTFKRQITLRLKSYLAELPFVSDDVSDLFLVLCNLMITGKLARMPDEVFKVFLTVIAYRGATKIDDDRDLEFLKEKTGIRETSALRKTLLDLEREGYLNVTEDADPLSNKS